MQNLENMTIKTKLQIMSLVTLFSLALLGFIFNYIFHTSKAIGIVINAERVYNNTFQEGSEDYNNFLLSYNSAYLDSAAAHIVVANQMAYNFATIDSLFKLPKEKYINIFFDSFKEAYDNNKDNAYLMCNRLKLLKTLGNDKYLQAQQVTKERYVLGEQIKERLHDIRKDRSPFTMGNMENDLRKMRVFHQDFAKVITSLNAFEDNLLFWGIIVVVILLMVLLQLLSYAFYRTIDISVNIMVKNFKIIARGNLNTEIPIYSDNEIGQMASSFREIQSGLRSVIEYTKKVADGDYSQTIAPRSNEDELSVALNKMVEKLKESYEK
jgi:methyl-accepting chemotaxis protein